MGGINARVSRAAQYSVMITPSLEKTISLSIQLEMKQTDPALKNWYEIFQTNITETLRGVFRTGISMRMSLA